MNLGASSSKTTQYEKSSKKGTRVSKFEFKYSEISEKLEELILTDKSIRSDDDKVIQATRIANIRDDYQQMALELLTGLLPFELPTEESSLKQEAEIERLLIEMQAARKAKPERTSTEDQINLQAFKKEKERLKTLNATLQSIKEINQHLLNIENIKQLSYSIEDYCEGRKRALTYESFFDKDSADYYPDHITKHVNKLLTAAKTLLLERFPMNFGKNNTDFSEYFDHLPKELTDTYKLRYAQSIIFLKNSELAAVSSPDDHIVQKNYLKEQILYSAQISQLQHDILQEMSRHTDPSYVKNVIDAALEPILEQFVRGERFGAYEFKYRESVKEQLQEILYANRKLLLDREANEINLELYNEQYACFSALADNPLKYGITTLKEGRVYEALKKQASDSREKAQAIQAELNNQLAQIIERFIDENTKKENQDTIGAIQSKLGHKATYQNLSEIMSEAEKNTQLGYYDWMFTKTFASRCKGALLMATTMGAVGAGVGGVAGLGIFSAFTAGVGGIGGGLTGLVTGFVAPNIEQTASSNLGELRNLAITLFYGEQNEFLKEYFEDPNNTKILAKKYSSTPRMIEAWGVDGANVIAHQYANLIFELHIKILYESDSQNKEDLEQKYKHFYRNYQMIRGDHAEIAKIYKGDFWGADRADHEIRKLERLNIKQQATDDLTALMLIVSSEEQMNIRKLRTAINNVTDGLQLLAIEGRPELLQQALEAPEVKRLTPAFEQDIVPKLLMITDASSIEDPQPSSSASPVSSSSSPASSSAFPVSSSSSPASSSAYPLALIPTIPTVPQQIVAYDPAALERQQLVTQVKQGAGEIVQAYQKKHEIVEQYAKIDSLATIARSAKTTTSDIERVSPGFIRLNTQFIGDMSAFDAISYLMQHKQSHFTFWYNNIFLFNNKATSNATRTELISRTLRDGKGVVQFDGKSLWHILAENSIEGSELFAQMMHAQQTAGFSPFIDYFDFDYRANNGMNAIVYAASLSSSNNSQVFRAYVQELMKGYKSNTEHQVNCDRTFKEVLELKSPHNPAYHIICMKLKDEIHTLWKRKEALEYAQKSYSQRIYSAVSARAGFDSDAVLSQLLATMAIHCTEGNPIPQTKAELIEFLNMYKESSYISNDMATLINRIEDVVHIAEVTKEVTKNNPLYEFAKDHPDEQIKNLAIELCTSMPIPTPEEQAILIAILANNIAHIEQLARSKDGTLIKLINKNVKFKEKNLIWISIEANRPEIAVKLYSISSYKAAMDTAGPNNASAFTFAASRDDKTACSLFCQEISNRTGYTQLALLSRFIPIPTGEIAFHYLAQSGSISEILVYFESEARYSTPDWHRLTGGPDEFKYHTDQKGNLPLHLLLSRDDAVNVVREIQDYINSKKLNTIFDLFDINSFELRNVDGKTPISLIMQNESLTRVCFEPLLIKADELYNSTGFRKILFTCTRFALEYGNIELLEQCMNKIQKVHENNKGKGYLANPVEREVGFFLDYLVLRLSNAAISEREIQIICELLKSNAKLASSAKQKSIYDANPLNQYIVDALPSAITGKVVSDNEILPNEISLATSNATPTSSSPSSSPDRTDDAPTRGSLLLSGGHQIPESESPRTGSSATSDPTSKKKKKHDPT